MNRQKQRNRRCVPSRRLLAQIGSQEIWGGDWACVRHDASVAAAYKNVPREDIDLSRLNDAERHVLGMLAEGHTAKSIATVIHSSPAAINERLREARRKTGVGSSRELARILKAQENRHEQIGVGNHHRIAADLSPDAAAPWRSQTGVYSMIGLFVVAAVGAVTLMTQQPAESPTDPLISTLQREPDVAELHMKVRAEQRGPWAIRMEQQIKARLMVLPLVGKNGNVLRVTCGNTICEIAGTLPGTAAGFSRTNTPAPPPPPPMGYLEKLGLKNGDLEKLGLKNENGNFIRWQGQTKPLVFLLYYSREDAAAK